MRRPTFVRAFAQKVFDIIEGEPDRLREVDGIGPVRAQRIVAAWAEQKVVREIMVFLHSHGVGTARAALRARPYPGHPGSLPDEPRRGRRRAPELPQGAARSLWTDQRSDILRAIRFGFRARASAWRRADKIPGGYVVRDANRQALAYVVYSRDSEPEALQAKVLTDEARRIAVNIARLPELLGKANRD
jgi:hypothetical protein